MRDAAAAIVLASQCQTDEWMQVRAKVWRGYCSALLIKGARHLSGRAHAAALHQLERVDEQLGHFNQLLRGAGENHKELSDTENAQGILDSEPLPHESVDLMLCDANCTATWWRKRGNQHF